MDPTPMETAAVLKALGTATQRLTRSVRGLTSSDLDVPSRLPGWTRRTVIAHLTYGADATARMLHEIPRGHIAFYPEGPGQRQRSLHAADQLPADEVFDRLMRSCRDLHEAAMSVPDGTWQLRVVEPRLGMMAASRLPLLRLNEVEVHHTDLGVGHDPSSWSPELIDIGLPLRVSWLARHHRHRSTNGPPINGAWRLVRTDRGQTWTITAEGPRVEIHDGVVDGEHEAVFTAEGCRLLAFLLGRDDLGQPELARRFKLAFPGP